MTGSVAAVNTRTRLRSILRLATNTIPLLNGRGLHRLRSITSLRFGARLLWIREVSIKADRGRDEVNMFFDLDRKAVLLTCNVRLLGIGMLIDLRTVIITYFIKNWLCLHYTSS